MSALTRSLVLRHALGVTLLVTPAVAAAQTPSPGELLARHEAALGGREALNKYSFVRLAGTISIDSGSMTGTIEILRSKDNKFVQKLKIQNLGDLWKGYDGTVAWTLEMSTPALLTDVDAAAMRSHAQWDHDYLAPIALQVGQVDTTEFEGQTVWRVTFAAELGLEQHAYFSRETGLRLGAVSTSTQGSTTTVYADYTEFGGVRIPARHITRADAGEMVITINKVEFDKLDSSAFNLPPAVKAIAKQ